MKHVVVVVTLLASCLVSHSAKSEEIQCPEQKPFGAAKDEWHYEYSSSLVRITLVHNRMGQGIHSIITCHRAAGIARLITFKACRIAAGIGSMDVDEDDRSE